MERPVVFLRPAARLAHDPAFNCDGTKDVVESSIDEPRHLTMKISAIAAAALAVTAAATCAVAGAARMAPSTGSDAIRALRTQPEGELRLHYLREVPGQAAETVAVGIAADYHYIQAHGGLRIYDYKLRRIFTVIPGNAFVSDSLYAEVWLRAMQLTSEVVRGRATLGTGASPQSAAATMAGPFWMESELGVVASELPRPALAQFGNQTGVHWMLGSEEVAVVAYQKDTVPDAIKGSLRRFWPTFTRVHPQIAAALATSGHMPAELSVRQAAPDGSHATAHWSLTTAQWEPAASFPLPPGLSARPTHEQGLYPAVFDTLAALHTENRRPPSQEAYRARTEAALSRGAGLEAMLWLIEMDLARGRPFPPCESDGAGTYCSMWAQATRLAHGDSRTGVAFMTQAPDAGDRSQFHSLPNAYLLRFLWATRPPGRGVAHDQSELDLLAALRASPVANFCKDAGMFYMSQGQPRAAWQAWDFGRTMAGHTWGDLLDSIDALEADLVTREPELF
jgi:hypothetical protein